MSDFLFRTFNMNPTDYERQLADALFAIMGRHVHDPAGIAAELEKSGPKPATGDRWTADLLKSEMQRLGTWTNSIGAPVGGHSAPGISVRHNEK